MQEITKITPSDDVWPEAVNQLDPAPEALWVQGNVDLLHSEGVALVGARASTEYGEHVTANLAGEATRAGWTVVSGGAYGIDCAAHRGALAVDGPTIAVLASGLDRPYPIGNAGLLQRIAAGGLLISEYEPGTTPSRHRFLRRNGLIGALATRGLVVVEASARSGSLNAARQAHEIGRPIYAVPGPITSATSYGTNQLIADGKAKLLTSVNDLV